MKALFIALALGVSGCGSESTSLSADRLVAPGGLRYRATTPQGQLLLAGRLIVNTANDSTLEGTWTSEWAPGADTTVEVGDQIGSGTLKGWRSGGRVYIDLNPGYADNNVILVATPAEKGFTGTWSWSTFAGPRAEGRFSALPE